jgi:hypothetical protein
MMADGQGEIADLEVRIEAALDGAEKCRKTVTAAKAAALFGSLLLLAGLFGLFRLGLEAILIGIGAALGGIVLSGSSERTRQDLLARAAEDEARRATLIASLDLHEIATP